MMIFSLTSSNRFPFSFVFFYVRFFLVENFANIVYIFHPHRMYGRTQLEDILEALKTNRLIRMPFQDDGG